MLPLILSFLPTSIGCWCSSSTDDTSYKIGFFNNDVDGVHSTSEEVLKIPLFALSLTKAEALYDGDLSFSSDSVSKTLYSKPTLLAGLHRLL